MCICVPWHIINLYIYILFILFVLCVHNFIFQIFHRSLGARYVAALQATYAEAIRGTPSAGRPLEIWWSLPWLGGYWVHRCVEGNDQMKTHQRQWGSHLKAIVFPVIVFPDCISQSWRVGEQKLSDKRSSKGDRESQPVIVVCWC